MKLLRIYLLVLLAVLLPVRGAMAAALLCPPAAMGAQSDMRSMHPATDHAANHATEHVGAGHGAAHDADAHLQHPHADATQHQQADAPQADHGTSSGDACSNLCSALCAMTPLMSASAGIAEPHGLVEAPYPAIAARASSFVLDGQERPPRSS